MTESDDGPVDAYLDRMFDLLAGSGRTGRRALAEVEAHLQEAVDAELAAGASRHAAELRAVRRFGPARTVAAGLLAAGGTLGLLVRRVVATAWLVGGVALVVIGLSAAPVWAVGRFLGADLVAPDPPGARYTAARCAELFEYAPHAASCRDASVAHHLTEEVRNRVLAGVLGVLVLVAFWLVHTARGRWLARFVGLTQLPPAPVFAAVAATAFGVVAAVLAGEGVDALVIGRRAATGATLASAGVSAVAFAVFVPALLRGLRAHLAEAPTGPIGPG